MRDEPVLDGEVQYSYGTHLRRSARDGWKGIYLTQGELGPFRHPRTSESSEVGGEQSAEPIVGRQRRLKGET